MQYVVLLDLTLCLLGWENRGNFLTPFDKILTVVKEKQIESLISNKVSSHGYKLMGLRSPAR